MNFLLDLGGKDPGRGLDPGMGRVHLDSSPEFAGRRKGVERAKQSVAHCEKGERKAAASSSGGEAEAMSMLGLLVEKTHRY